MEINYIKNVVKAVLEILVQQKYDELLKNDFLKLFNPSEIEYAVNDYGLNLTMPLEDAFITLQVFETNSPGLVKVNFHLWSDNEISDYTLCLAVYSDINEFKYAVEDIRML